MDELTTKRLEKAIAFIEEAMDILIKEIPPETAAHEITAFPAGKAHYLIDDSRELINKVINEDEEDEEDED